MGLTNFDLELVKNIYKLQNIELVANTMYISKSTVYRHLHEIEEINNQAIFVIENGVYYLTDFGIFCLELLVIEETIDKLENAYLKINTLNYEQKL